MEKIISIILSSIIFASSSGVIPCFALEPSSTIASAQPELIEGITKKVIDSTANDPQTIADLKTTETLIKDIIANTPHEQPVKSVKTLALAKNVAYYSLKAALFLGVLAVTYTAGVATKVIYTVDYNQLLKHSPSDGGLFEKVLGISEGASCDTLKKAYRKAAFVLHPDKVLNPQMKTYFTSLFGALSAEYQARCPR